MAVEEPHASDARLLRRSFAVARAARAAGNHPFGALLAGPDGTVLMEQGNVATGRDRTAHAERVLMSRASQAYPPELLRDCTMYASAEPCAMCAGAVYWTGVGRVVYGLGERDLKAITGPHRENPTLDLPCRTVFAAGQRPTTVVGPLLDAEAAGLHEGAWADADRLAGEAG